MKDTAVLGRVNAWIAAMGLCKAALGVIGHRQRGYKVLER
jgi:hypothetical protein